MDSSLFVLLQNTKFMNKFTFNDFSIEMKKIVVYKFTTYNLQNYPTFHLVEKLVNSVRRRERFVCHLLVQIV